MKIECHISDTKSKIIEDLCNGYTFAEFNRRAIDFYLENYFKLQFDLKGALDKSKKI